MIEFSRNVECLLEHIMMDNVRNVEVIVGAWLWSTILYLHRVREGMSVKYILQSAHLYCKLPFWDNLWPDHV